jgi:hypothetical protein
MLVADIKEEVIIGMDIMNSRGFQLDFKRGTLTVNDEEVVLHGKSDEVVSLLLGEDTSIPERSEMILLACLDYSARLEIQWCLSRKYTTTMSDEECWLEKHYFKS